MLEQINSARNMGNANAALARSNFARADQIAMEFLVRLIRLAARFQRGPRRFRFYEDAAFSLVNSLIEQMNSRIQWSRSERLATRFSNGLGPRAGAFSPPENSADCRCYQLRQHLQGRQEETWASWFHCLRCWGSRKNPTFLNTQTILSTPRPTNPAGEELSLDLFEEERRMKRRRRGGSGVEGEDEGNVEITRARLLCRCCHPSSSF